MLQANRVTRRRALHGFLAVTSAVTVPWLQARAETAGDAGPIVPVRLLDDALLAAMKSGKTTPFAQRFTALAPVIEQTIDLDAVLALSVGLGWSVMPDDQKLPLRAAFLRYTVASYAASFSSYSGQTFQISPTLRELGAGEVIVQTRIVATDGSANALDYRMRNGQSGWKAVDVLEDGAISRVAVQRSDFRGLLANGGVPALMTALQQKAATLSGGLLA